MYKDIFGSEYCITVECIDCLFQTDIFIDKHKVNVLIIKPVHIHNKLKFYNLPIIFTQ